MAKQKQQVKDQEPQAETPAEVIDQSMLLEKGDAGYVNRYAEPIPEEPNSGTVETAIKEAFSQEGAGGDAAQTPPVASKRVEVLFNGRLGPRLLTRGDITDDPDYVALLDDGRELVREVGN